MGVAINNINYKNGYDFNKYLSSHVLDIEQNIDMHQEYLMKGITATNNVAVEIDTFKMFTRSGGELLDALNLSGYLDRNKLNEISKLCVGEHELTKGFKKQKIKFIGQ